MSEPQPLTGYHVCLTPAGFSVHQRCNGYAERFGRAWVRLLHAPVSLLSMPRLLLRGPDDLEAHRLCDECWANNTMPAPERLFMLDAGSRCAPSGGSAET